MDTSPSLSTLLPPPPRGSLPGLRRAAGGRIPAPRGVWLADTGLAADLAQRSHIPTGQSSLEQGVARSHLGCSVGRALEPFGGQSTLVASHRAQPC